MNKFRMTIAAVTLMAALAGCQASAPATRQAQEPGVPAIHGPNTAPEVRGPMSAP